MKVSGAAAGEVSGLEHHSMPLAEERKSKERPALRTAAAGFT